MSTFNRATLAKVLEVLASDHDGEALTAAKLASAMVRDAGLAWDEVIAKEIQPRLSTQPPTPAEGDEPAPRGRGLFSRRHRHRDLSSYEQLFLVLLSRHTPPEIKRALRGWESRILDGEITAEEKQDLKFMYRSYVA